jgi:hypothetical protein
MESGILWDVSVDEGKNGRWKGKDTYMLMEGWKRGRGLRNDINMGSVVDSHVQHLVT